MIPQKLGQLRGFMSWKSAQETVFFKKQWEDTPTETDMQPQRVLFERISSCWKWQLLRLVSL
jgi:hypothetical protein